MKNLFKKGMWYYEIQILMFVFMWLHNKNHKPSGTTGIWLGRLHIWYDTQWTTHGFPGKIRWLWIDLTWNAKHGGTTKDKLGIVWKNLRHKFVQWFMRKKSVTFLISLHNYLELNKAGFRISSSGDDLSGVKIYRFWWGKTMIKDIADIDCVNGYYNTLLNGHKESLGPTYEERLAEIAKRKPKSQRLTDNVTRIGK